ncbi:hypothetical protein BKA70DRAFT_1113294 [Coprinopsis sp. MPI-PUGE-AT-0042]|nr:hypothetical protein BKA70DRAFT_1113294 [Coprinopsis sp. MPI-PUGE-AT-0042]
MLEPQGFYDAINAYGLPSTIIDLDRSAQSNVPYSIKTAYGLSPSFIVNDVTKQGGPLSPLKCSLTTSLANRWLYDLSSSLPGSFRLSSHNSRLNLFHTPSDDISLMVSMLEAMDDSLIFATSLPVLHFLVFHAEQFQGAYGWVTSWVKSKLYAYQSSNDDVPPETTSLPIPSVDPANPGAQTPVTHNVPVERDHTTFLRVPINRPDLQASHIRDLIENFSFPPTYSPLPITALRRIISQSLISKIRPLLSFQPLLRTDAECLDHLLASKVHSYLHMPFRFKTDVLTAPLSSWGLDFPSISRLNDTTIVQGFLRDLNHPNQPFFEISNITLADWSCQLRNCHSPFSQPLPRLIRTARLRAFIPSSWIAAQDLCRRSNWPLKDLNQGFFWTGNVGLPHLQNLLSPSNRCPHRHLAFLLRRNSHLLSDLGSWLLLDGIPKFRTHDHPSSSSALATVLRWPDFTSWINNLPASLVGDVVGSHQALLPRQMQQRMAEQTLLSFTNNPFIPKTHIPSPHLFPLNTFASDASRVPFSVSNSASVTFAATSRDHNSIRTSCWSLAGLGGNRDVAEGEVYGILLSALQALSSPLPPHIWSDHLASIKLLQQNASFISPSHPYPHTSSSTPEAIMNRWVDQVASHAHPPMPLSSAPVPTFTMDRFTLVDEHLGFLTSKVGHWITSQWCASHRALPDSIPVSLFDCHPPPTYPYLRASSAYSIRVQLYSRSRQLDSEALKAKRLDSITDTCRFGCSIAETTHHLMVSCPRFSKLRESACHELLRQTETILNTCRSRPDQHPLLVSTIASLCRDGPHWPTHHSQYYMGLLPPLGRMLEPTGLCHLTNLQRHNLVSKLAASLHTGMIRCAGKIWSEVRSFSFRTSHPSKSRRLLALPSHLRHIKPSDSEDCSFDISYI